MKNEVSLNVYSSFVFLTNATLAYYFDYFMYSFLFIGLFATSVINHYYQTIMTNIIDKVSVGLVVVYGYNVFTSKCFELEIFTWKQYILVLLILLTFVSTIHLYCYGYICKEYCFCPHIRTQQYYHIFMHCMASLGHHMIILL